MQNTELPPFDALYRKLRSCDTFESDYTDYDNLFKSGLNTEQTVIKLKLSNLLPAGIENYQDLQQKRRHEQKSSFKEFLRWYNNKGVLPTLEALKKMIAFYHDKDMDILKFGCNLPNLANICLHRPTVVKFYAITELAKNLLEKHREDVVGGPSIVFTRKVVVVVELFFENQQTYANLLLGLTLANYSPTRCVNPFQPVLIRVGISIQRRVGLRLDKTRPAALKLWSCPIFNEQDQHLKLKTSLQQADRRKLTALVLFVLLCPCSRTYCCYHVTSNKLKSRSKGLNKRVLEQTATDRKKVIVES